MVATVVVGKEAERAAERVEVTAVVARGVEAKEVATAVEGRVVATAEGREAG